jgi:small ligand-binding sensory domain FIST
MSDILGHIDPQERELFEECALLGVCEEPSLHEDDRAPFEIRQIVGVDDVNNAIILDEPIPENCIVRFHVGDPYFSHEFLLENLKRHQEEFSEDELSGALVFSCSRRGEAFYHEQGHETTVFKECFSSVPLGGFFSYGELVQHQGKARICGLSSAFAFFRPRRPR